MNNELQSIANNISVVIPNYNKAKYIERCIQSVLNQTMTPNEIIVVDDGSIDDSVEIMQSRFGQQIKLIKQQNSGESVARNNGIEKAESEYVALLDADDEWLDTFIEKICFLIRDFPNDGIYSTAYKLVSADSEKIPTYSGLTPKYTGVVVDYFAASMNGWSLLSSSSTVLSKSLFNKVGKFTPDLRLGADLDLWSRLALASKIAFLNEPHVKYHYFNESSVTNTPPPSEELLYIKHLTDSLESGQVPVYLRPSVKRFIAKGLQYLVCEQAKQGNHSYLLSAVKDKRLYHYLGKSTFKMLFAIAVPHRIYTFSKRIVNKLSSLFMIQKAQYTKNS